MKVIIYSHNNGESVIPDNIRDPLLDKIKNMHFDFNNGNVRYLRRMIISDLKELGWTDRIPVNVKPKISITAINNDIGLCLQISNMARIYADLLKLQYLYEKGRIKSGIYLILTKNSANLLDENVANFERLTQELIIYCNIINLPICVIGFEGEYDY